MERTPRRTKPRMLVAALLGALIATACSSDEPIGTTIAAEVAGTDTAGAIEPRTISGTVVVVHGRFDVAGEIANAAGDVPVDGTELLFARNAFSDQALVPLVDPAGSQVTLEGWTRAAAQATARCDDDGTIYEFEFEGLLPNGVYTLWQHLLKAKSEADFEMDPNDPGATNLASGSLDAAPFVDAVVTADADGSGRLVVVSPPGPMSMFGERSACAMTDAETVMLVLNYHMDGETWGEWPGPDHLDAGHLHIFFQQDDLAT